MDGDDVKLERLASETFFDARRRPQIVLWMLSKPYFHHFYQAYDLVMVVNYSQTLRYARRHTFRRTEKLITRDRLINILR